MTNKRRKKRSGGHQEILIERGKNEPSGSKKEVLKKGTQLGAQQFKLHAQKLIYIYTYICIGNQGPDLILLVREG
jgi:hypothetical protein